MHSYNPNPSPRSHFYLKRFEYFLEVIGLILAVVSFIAVIVIGSVTTRQLKSLTVELQMTTKKTNDSLKDFSAWLEQSDSIFSSLNEMGDSLNGAISSLPPVLDNMAELMGDNLVELSNQSQIALESAAQSSALYDNTLDLLSRVPFLNLNYKPEIPLQTSLNNLAEKVSEIPVLLLTIQSNLESSANELDGFSKDTSDLKSHLDSLDDLVFSTKPLIDTYLEQTEKLCVTLQEKSTTLTRKIWLLTLLLALICLYWFSKQLLRVLNLSHDRNSGKIPS
ncbi:MAG: hypothetical protein ACOYKD_03780 [Anaerolineaceae bacterium]|jgi:uncharacterized protein YoxC